MTNYIYYDYAQSKIAKVKEANIEYEQAPNVQSYLNIKCLENGSTLEGRKEAFSYLMKQKKFIPVVVSIHPIEIYLPTSSLKDPQCQWINYATIKNIEYKKETCIIQFKDDTSLECLYPNRIKTNMHTIYRYLKKLSAVSTTT